MAPQSGARRALRDLVPVTLVTGAAGLVVALVVGGTASEIRRAFVVDGAREVAGPAAGFTPATPVLPSADGVTVQVRPARPDPLDVVSFLDSLPPPAPTRSEGVDTVVAGVVVSRPPAVPAAFARVGATVVAVPPTAPPTVPEVAPPSPRPSSTEPNAKGKPARRRTAPSVSKTWTELVVFADDGSDDGKVDKVDKVDKADKADKADKDDENDRGRRDRERSSDRVPAHGRRSR